MANFQKNGQNVHGMTLYAPGGAKLYEVGLWGPLDPRDDQELTVEAQPPKVGLKIEKGRTLPNQPVRVWQLKNLPKNDHFLLIAFDAGGSVWTQVTINTGGYESVQKNADGRYTTHANEVVTKNTKPTASEVISMLKLAWPQLNEQGRRTLTAQCWGETGVGEHLYNWNLGNVKASDAEPHMYLQNVWECVEPAQAASDVAKAKGLARIADTGEVISRGWKCPKTTVVFSPPHPAARFKAYASLTEGAKRWVGLHQKIAAGTPGYLGDLNKGDTAAVAKTLKKNRYYTAAEADYAAAMKRHKAGIDAQFGPAGD